MVHNFVQKNHPVEVSGYGLDIVTVQICIFIGQKGEPGDPASKGDAAPKGDRGIYMHGYTVCITVNLLSCLISTYNVFLYAGDRGLRGQKG